MNEHDTYQLADILKKHYKLSTWSIFEQCADKLRKLQRENELLHKQQVDMTALRKQRDALLEALKLAKSIIGHPDDAHSQMIDAAIKLAEENKL